MALPIQPSCRDDFAIAIICALPLEYDAVSLLFDKFFDEDGDCYGRASGDFNSYATGRIGKHDVVLALLSQMGKTNAASAAASLRSSYGGVRLVLLVGICGGVPSGKDKEILLGDVVISKTVVQYDFGRQYPDKFVRKDTSKDSLSIPNRDIRNLLVTFETDRGLKQLQQKTAHFLRQLQANATQDKPEGRYSYPGTKEDKLFLPSYRHKHHVLPTPPCICRNCNCISDPICDDALHSSCDDLGCDRTYSYPRPREPLERKQRLEKRKSDKAQEPAIHLGPIASGDTVMKSGEDRDRIAKKEGVIAFEMEGAGVWEEIPCIVVKGVCDYADCHKTKKWQNFAAATAASTSKSILERYTRTDKISQGGMDMSGRDLMIQSAFRFNYRRATEASHVNNISGQQAMDSYLAELTMPKCVRQLWPTKPRDDREVLGIRKGGLLPNTCQWLLEHGFFNAWLSWNGRSLFWLYGGPGRGKTMLALSVAQELERRTAGSTLFTVVFFYWDDVHRTSVAMLRSVIYQLIEKHSWASKYLEDEYNHQGENLFQENENAFCALWRVFQKIRNKYPNYTLYIILDALDECEPTSSQWFLDRLLWELKSPDPSMMKLKIFFTARPLHESIKTKFGKFGTWLEINRLYIDHDVRAYIKHRVREFKNILDAEALSRIEDNLVRKCESMFLWVEIVTREMDKVPPDEAEELLGQYPKGLDAVYKKVLEEIAPGFKEAVRLLLIWAVSPFRQLTLPQLAMAVSLSRRPEAKFLPKENDAMNALRAILAHARSLIQLDETTQSIRLEHSSLKDFLKPKNAQNHFKIFQTLAHNLCLDDMEDVRVKRSIRHSFFGRDRKPIFRVHFKELEPKANALRHYACDFWMRHANECLELLKAFNWTFCGHSDFFFTPLHERIRNSFKNVDILKRQDTKWTRCQAVMRRVHSEQVPDDMFIVASAEGCLPFVEYYVRVHILGPSPDPALRQQILDEALLEAAEHGQIMAVEYLISVGANITATTDFCSEGLGPHVAEPVRQANCGRTALHYAAIIGHRILAGLLLEESQRRQMDTNPKDIRGLTPLHYAVEQGQVEITHLLLKYGADPRCKDLGGSQPLHYVARREYWPVYGNEDSSLNYSEKVRSQLSTLLIEFGVDGRDHNMNGMTPLDYAMEQALHDGEDRNFKMLLEASMKSVLDPTPNRQDTANALQRTTDDWRYEMARKILGVGVDIEYRDEYARTRLLRAARTGEVEMVFLLLERGANILAKDEDGNTALHLAVGGLFDSPGLRLNTVQLLVNACGALLTMRNDLQQVALEIVEDSWYTKHAPYVECVGWYEPAGVEDIDPGDRSECLYAWYWLTKMWEQETGSGWGSPPPVGVY